ncbi:MAG: 23S rRNA (uracil(1939)-C(5))-methyltransferase RlmD [Woeseia sp.]|nr:23S rRNA (uracil(1939)-C(5))-methyltransferase RlmD [Woeseia sp.]NNE62076.1 23S rRNA (uracil(1939)-C(5))-methyltransferase RlmD [Woeseia sp.]NNL54329.1 23S rRNA (uracil(1939)-C(5))-methyltransferase RlmD [Woeseia sp.]
MARKKTGPETALITAATHDGRGIAAVEGKKVFVAGALAGETVRFQRRKRRRNFDEAELLEVIEPSAERVAPRCAVFGTCGGCSLQHQSQETQRNIKFEALQNALQRIGGVTPGQWFAPLYDDGENGGWNYRRRARLAVKDVAGKGRVLVGFRERHAPYVADMQRCEILARPVDAMLTALSEIIGTLSIRARLPQIEVAVGDVQTRLVLRVLDPPTAEDRAHLAEFAKSQNVSIALQTGGLDSIEDLYPAKPDALSYRLPEFGIALQFDATDFVQVNAEINRRMVARAIELLAPGANDRVLDLFCGIGNFSLPLARNAAEVLGIEGEARQVQRAAANAARNGIKNAHFVTADLSEISGKEAWLAKPWQRVLLDPARSGALDVVKQMKRINPERIVYVSCHAATLARDAAELIQLGYALSGAGIIDMFPHTAHVESIAVFEKK